MEGNVLQSWRVRIVASLGIFATLSILGILVYQGRESLLTYDWQVNWVAILLAFGILIATFIIVTYTWIAEMRALGSTLPTQVHLNHYIVSHLIRRLPGTIWYIAGRSYLYRQQGESARLVAVVSSLELVLLTIAAAIVALLLWGAGFQQLPGGSHWMIVGMIGVGLLLVQPRISRWFLRRVGKVDTPMLHYRQIIPWLFSYIIAWLGSGLIFYLIAYAFTGLGSEHMLYTIGAWALVGALSVVVFFLPSNFGFTEIGLTVLMSAVMPIPVAAALTLIARMVLTVFDLLVVGLWLSVEAIWRKIQSEHSSAPQIEE